MLQWLHDFTTKAVLDSDPNGSEVEVAGQAASVTRILNVH